jgi:hypothetical protein
MKSKLIPLALNELLDRPLIVSFNFRIWFSELRCPKLDSLVSRSVSNARINRARAKGINIIARKDDESHAIPRSG